MLIHINYGRTFFVLSLRKVIPTIRKIGSIHKRNWTKRKVFPSAEGKVYHRGGKIVPSRREEKKDMDLGK